MTAAVSSASNEMCPKFRAFLMSFMNSKNNKGPNVLSCGTPTRKGRRSDGNHSFRILK